MYLSGFPDGLHSLRGPVRVEWGGAGDVARGGAAALACGGGRALLLYGGALAHAGLLALGSALRRASSLHPVLEVSKVRLPDSTPPHLLKVSFRRADGHFPSDCMFITIVRDLVF